MKALFKINREGLRTFCKATWEWLKTFLKVFYGCLYSLSYSIAKKWHWILIMVIFFGCLLLFTKYHYEEGLGIFDSTIFMLNNVTISVTLSIVGVVAIFLILFFIASIIKASIIIKKAISTETNAKDSKNATLPPINAGKLEPYFLATFKGTGNRPNNFQMMLDRLEVDRHGSATNVGKIARLFYESHVLSSNKPNTFSEWIDIFFSVLGLEPPKDKSKNKYKFDPKKDADAKLKQKYQVLL